MTPRVWLSRGSPVRRMSGFTLLEILIAMVLASALMTMLWGTFNMYLRMFETGERVTREAQLLLGMSRQFTDSIQGVPALAPLPAASSELSFSAFPEPLGNELLNGEDFPTNEPESLPVDESFLQDSEAISGMGLAGTAGVSGSADATQSATELPRFGLIGSYDRLTLYGVQLVPELMPFGDFTESSDTTKLPGVVEDQPPGASELRTIHFRFLQPERSPNHEAGATHRGLLRIDTAWHEADASSWTDDRLQEFLMEAEDEESGRLEAVDLQIAQVRRQRDGMTTLSPDHFLLFAEVCGIKFRFYDGYFWRDAWDSRLEGCLPLAVEICLQFRDERLRRQQLLRRNLQRDPAMGQVDREADEEELEEDWNTLELFDPDGVRSGESDVGTDGPVFRVLVPCAGAASDAHRSTGTEEGAEVEGGVPSDPVGGPWE